MGKNSSPNVYELAIPHLRGAGHKHAKKLLEAVGSAEAVFSLTAEEMEGLYGIGEPLAAKIVASMPAAIETAKIIGERLASQSKIKTLFYLNDDYPMRLRHCMDAPVLLYYKGQNILNNARVLSIVGTRRMTRYGATLVKQTLKQWQHENMAIVSGLAFGVDITVHRHCLKNNIPTVAVLGSAIDDVRPIDNKSVARAMTVDGMVVSENPPGSKIHKYSYPARNRVIAGLSDAVIVIESGKKGGALITARIANSYNREVFAFPGRSSDAMSKGCNELVKRHEAVLIESASDVLVQLNWQDSNGPNQTRLFRNLSGDERIVINLLHFQEETLSMLLIKSSFTLTKLQTVLLNLELDGIIQKRPGNKYQLT